MSALLIYGTAAAIALAILFGVARRFLPRSRRAADPSLGPLPPEIHVLSRQRVGAGRSLVIVEVSGRRLLLGSSAEQWSMLADLGGVPDPMKRDYSVIDAELSRALQASTRHGRGFRRP